ncbi:MAG: SMI1/KNR4 family protein [Verrucomicrobiota bacterium]
MSFWKELTDEGRSVVKELPPLSDEMVAVCEKKFGIKFPQSLLELLRTQNGGFLENSDFKIAGKDYRVREIMGIGDGEGFREIRPWSYCFSNDDALEKDIAESLQKEGGDLSRLLLFGDDDYVCYALDYNFLNSDGEPTVICAVPDPETTEVRRVANSFSELLKSHYFGDVEPTVQMEEALRYTLIAEGGYNGTLRSTDATIVIKWKICSEADRLIIFQQEDWGWGEKRERSEISKSSLDWSPIPLEGYGVDVEPDLAKLIRPTVEAECLDVTLYDVPTTPKCFQLNFRIPIGEQNRIKKTTSEAYEGRWKNESSKLIHACVYSDNKAALKKTLAMLSEKPKGWRRFFS